MIHSYAFVVDEDALWTDDRLGKADVLVTGLTETSTDATEPVYSHVHSP